VPTLTNQDFSRVAKLLEGGKTYAQIVSGEYEGYQTSKGKQLCSADLNTWMIRRGFHIHKKHKRSKTPKAKSASFQKTSHQLAPSDEWESSVLEILACKIKTELKKKLISTITN
jgi:hypothetical protein